MKRPLFTIIIPCYNVDEYLKDSVTSIIYQTFSNWEMILVDDGSTDSTSLMINSFVMKDARIHAYFQTNKGVSAARNLGIRYATGKYVYFMDADDVVEHDALSFIASLLTNVSPDLIVFGYQKVNSENEIIRYRIPPYNKVCYTDKEIKQAFLLMENSELFNPPWNKMYKLSIINQQGIRFPKLSVGEDAVFNYRFFSHLKNVYLISKSLYAYKALRIGSATERQRYKVQVPEILIQEKKKAMQKLGLSTVFLYESDLIIMYYDLFKRILVEDSASKIRHSQINYFKKNLTIHHRIIHIIVRNSIRNNIKLFLICHTHLFTHILYIQKKIYQYKNSEK